MAAAPLEHFAEGCRAGELRYTVDAGGDPVWPPQAGLDWRVSAGHGSVFATCVVRPRDGAPRDLSFVALDEGFRIMSRVDGVAPEDVAIGMRVRLAWDGETPVFRRA
jgi:hypothetical protein